MESFNECVQDFAPENRDSTIAHALRCCIISEYRLVPGEALSDPEPNDVPSAEDSSPAPPLSFTMKRPGWTTLEVDEQGNAIDVVMPLDLPVCVATAASEDLPWMSRKELEARVGELRAKTPQCEPYTRDKVDFKTDVNLSRRSGDRHMDDAYDLIERAAKQHVFEANRRPMTMPRVVYMGIPEFVQTYVPEELHRRIEKFWNGDVNKIIDKYFSVDGDANLAATRADQLKIWHERQHWATTILRTHALDMSGAIKSNVLLQGLASPIPSSQTIRGDRHTLFYERAKAYLIPTAEKVQQGVKANSTSTHPQLASFRHANVAGLRELVNDVGAHQQDISISSASRDKLAHGIRHIMQLKDFKHVGPSEPPLLETRYKTPCEQVSGRKPKIVTTLVDTAMYMKSLRPWAGTDIIMTVPMYPGLSGKTGESTWYCTGVDSDGNALYYETIGSDEVSSVFHNQYSWWFTNNDVVYIRTEDDSAFGIYNVVKHARRDINRQTVFLCLDTMVNLPFAIADQLVYAAHGTHLSDMFSEPRPCRNVVVVNPASANPILLMNAGSAHQRRLYTRYQKETSPEGTAVVSPVVLRYLEHLHANGGRSFGLSSQEHLTRLQLHMKEHLEGGVINAPDYASMLELLRVVGVPDNLPNAVFYAEGYAAEHPGEEAPSEDRMAKAVQQVPSIVDSPKVYGAIAPNDAAIKSATKAHLGKGNTTTRGPQLNRIIQFATSHFIDAMADQSGCGAGSILVVPREEVLANRTRSTQVANETTYGLGPSGKNPVGNAFVKTNEVAPVKEAPRMVNSPPHELSIDSGRLGMSLDRILKRKCGVSNGIDWFAPGKTPSEMSDAVRTQYQNCHDYRATAGAGKIPQVDYKAADDSHTEESATLMADVIEYFFSDDLCPDLGMSHKAWALQTYWECFDISVLAGIKVKSTKWKNASGTGITTLLNTLVFAFRSYLTVLLSLCFQQLTGDDGNVQGMPLKDGKSDPIAAGTNDFFTHKQLHVQLRKLQTSGVVFKAVHCYETALWDRKDEDSHRQTVGGTTGVTTVFSDIHTPVMRLLFDLIGLKFGDDGLECNVPTVSDPTWNLARMYLDAADGFTRTVDFSDPILEEPIEFLSRKYPNPFRTGASYCKIERAAEKLAISTNSEKEKYRYKLVGYLVTDRFTPVIGAFIDAIWATKNMGPDPIKYDPESGTATLSEKYLSKVEGQDRETSWKMRDGPYPVTKDDLDIMYQTAAADYGMTSSELRAFDDNLRKQTTLDGIRGCRLPVALQHLTAENPTGDGLTKLVPPGVNMVAAWSKDDQALLNAKPATFGERSPISEILEVAAQDFDAPQMTRLKSALSHKSLLLGYKH